MLIGFLYVLFSLIGFGYFLFLKRRLDFLTIGFVSQQIYFSPCLVYYFFSGHPDIYPVEVGVYITGILLIISFIFFSINLYENNKNRQRIYINFGFKYHALFSTLLASTAFVLSIIQSGDVLFSGAKADVLDSINRFYILWSICALYGILISYLCKQKIYFFINLFLLLVTIYIGFRSIAAIAAISLLVFYFVKENKATSLIFEHYKSALLAVFFGAFFLVYKGLYIAIKFKDYEMVLNRLLDKQFYIDVLVNAEPFGIQMIFSDVLNQDYYIGLENLNRFILLFTLFSNDLGIDARSFNQYFQSDLYGDVGYGMGSNVWAHMYSSGGWMLLVIFIIIYALSLRWFSYKIYYSNYNYAPLLIVLGSYWSFYIHRNDLFYQLGLEKRVLIVFVIVSILSLFYSRLKTTFKR
ncbi:O-antigen polymerase [Acinetobacter haemolyticus]|uniref:O-antigen polymerase n=1 Tax=Acinetobacter haemolyticus TaxID=29430 RepID=UPI00300BDA25